MRNFIQNIKNLNCLNCLMQIFEKPLNRQTIMANYKAMSGASSQVESTLFPRILSRMSRTCVGLSSNSILTRLCLVSLILMTIGVGEMWAEETYEVNLANTNTTEYTKSGEIKLTFSSVSKNSNGFALTNKIASWLASSSEKDFKAGSVSWSSQKTGYSVKVTKAEATFKTNISTNLYGVQGRVYQGSDYSAYTGKMYGSTNNPKTINITNTNGFGSPITFTTGHNSLGGETYLNKLKLTYSFAPNTYTVNFLKEPYGSSAYIESAGSATVTYDAKYNEGTGWIESTPKTGYTFAGWYKSDGTTRIQGTDVVKITATTGLYAHWTANTYDVTLNANGGEGNNQVVTATYDAEMPGTLKAGGAIVKPTKTGYTFAGYYDTNAATGGTPYYNANLGSAHVWDKASTATLYARWTANKYTVYFNSHGGSAVAAKTVTYDDTYGELTSSTREGYRFDGWFTEEIGGTQVTASTKVEITGPQTLHAHWTANKYRIILDSQGADESGTTSLEVIYDEVVPTEITMPEKTNCTFEGYYTEINGGGTKRIDKTGAWQEAEGFIVEGKWKNAGDVTLRAYWKQNQTIVWTLADGEGVEYATGQVMGAYAVGDRDSEPSKLTITYTTDPSNVATVDAYGKLNVKIRNTIVTVYAQQVGGDQDYNESPQVSKTFKTCGTKPDDYEVSAEPIDYGQKLGESVLSGTASVNGSTIQGEWKWVESDSERKPNAGTYINDYKAYFDPNDKEVYDTIIRPVTVTVNKVHPVFDWGIAKISNELRANMHYYNFFTTSFDGTISPSYKSNNGLSLSFEGKDKNVLVTGNVTIEEKKKTGTITIKLTDSKNYLDLETSLDVTVLPRPDVCLPVALTEDNDDSERLMTNMRVGSDNSSWCNSNNDGEEIYKVIGTKHNVRYTQSVGIALGTWEDGFSGLNWQQIKELLEDVAYNILHRDSPKNLRFTWSPKSIELEFTGVPDKISFSTELQKVSFQIFQIGDYYEVEPSAPKWQLWQKAPGGEYEQVGYEQAGTPTYSNLQLKEETRCVKIVYSGNFAGFIKNLTITRKDPYIEVKDGLQPEVFGTKTHPLQQPQTLTVKYASIGNDCNEPGRIDVRTTGPFYVDDITRNVNLDDIGEFSIRVRCNDVNQSGTVIFKDQDENPLLTVPVSSANPVIYTGTATDGIFQTGSEHASAGNDDYRALHNHNFTKCFDGSGNPRFDYLYIYGVTENLNHNVWDGNPKVPAFVATDGTAEGTASTPCFVYAKIGNQYEYVNRTFDAANTELTISENKKIWISGYRPANKPSASAIQINSNANVYLDSTEIIASGSALIVNAADVKLSVRKQNNSLTSLKGAAVQLAGESAKLTINDSWVDEEASADLALKSADGKPSIELGAASDTVVINGTQLKLQNADKRAIAQMSGEKELTGGVVRINDGTITKLGTHIGGGRDTLGMPLNTLIDGGTFNDGPIQVYDAKNKAKRPRNSRGELLARIEKDYDFYKDKDYEWYRHKYLKDVAGKVYPMLLDESLCIFHGKNGTSKDASKDENWNRKPSSVDDDEAWIRNDIEIKKELVAKSIIMDKPVTVLPTGGITVGEGGIEGSTVDNFTLKAAQDGAAKGQTGFLRISPAYNDTMPHATVELFSKAYYDPYSSDKDNTASWQYVGIPIETKDYARTIFKRSRLYDWEESSGTWSIDGNLVMKPFYGYCTTQYRSDNGLLITFKGQLVERKDQVLKVAYSPESPEAGCNVFANSYSAPIDISRIDPKDFQLGDKDDATINLFNTGSKIQIDNQAGKDVDEDNVDAPGQYIPVPARNAKEMAKLFTGFPTIIAPMQGFFVNTSKEGTLTLRYEDVVWNNKTANSPLRSKRRVEAEEDDSPISSGAMKVTLSTDEWKDRVYLLESEQYSTTFEKGIDARKMVGGNFNIFAVADEERLAVNATNSINNTYLGVRTGEDMYYKIRFTNLYGETKWSLLDKETNEMTEIEEGTEYSFYAEPNSEVVSRFVIVERANTPQITTGTDETTTEVKVKKFIKDDQLFVLKNGVLYNAQGKVVR